MNALVKALCFSCSLSLAVLNPLLAGEGGSAPSTEGSAVSKPASGAGQPSQPSPALIFKDGRISADFKDLPVGRLGEEISHKAGVAVLLQDNAGDELISAKFQNLPVDEGLRQILRKQDVFFFYGVDEGQASSLKAVWVYPKGRGRGLAPTSPAQWQSTKEIEAMLGNKDPRARGRAVETLVERSGVGAKDAVLKAIHDGNDQVRSSALYAAVKSGLELPEGELTDIALHDRSADNRFLALESLARSDSSQTRSIAEEAAKDPSEAVRIAAQEIIARLNAQAGPVAPPQSSPPQQVNQSPENNQ